MKKILILITIIAIFSSCGLRSGSTSKKPLNLIPSEQDVCE